LINQMQQIIAKLVIVVKYISNTMAYFQTYGLF